MITINTLENISKHSNKLIKAAIYFSQSNDNIIVDKLSIIDKYSGIDDVLEAFNKDLSDTASELFSVVKLLTSLNSDGIIQELNNEEKNISVLFGDNYNKEDNSLTLGNIKFNLNKLNNYTKKEIENMLCFNILGVNHNEFRKDYKYKLDNNIESDIFDESTLEEKLAYLNNFKFLEKIHNYVSKITKISIDFTNYRKKLSDYDKNIIDRKINSSRSMIDSITQNSTYIDSNNIIQISSKHKKEKEKVNEIFNLIKNSIIEDIELDQDTDLNKVINVLQNLSKYKFNLQNKVTFKVRKLGNYRVNGLYIGAYNIVAVDLNTPQALIHELTHAVDLNNKDIFLSKSRKLLIQKGLQNLDKKELLLNYPDNFVNYLLNPNEIIARMGEISFLLNEYNYKGEDLKQFFNKSEIMQQQEKVTANDIQIVKTIDRYRQLSSMYFNFENLSQEDALFIKDYYQSYFNKQDHEIKEINDNNISFLKTNDNSEKTTYKSIKKTGIYNVFTNLNHETLEFIFEKNNELNLVDRKTLINSILFNSAFLSRDNIYINKAGNDSISKAFSTIDKLFDYAKSQDDDFKKDLFVMTNFILSTQRKYSYKIINEQNKKYVYDILNHNRFIIPNVLCLKKPIAFRNKLFNNLQSLNINENILNKTIQEINNFNLNFIDISYSKEKNSMIHKESNVSFDNDNNVNLKNNFFLNLADNTFSNIDNKDYLYLSIAKMYKDFNVDFYNSPNLISYFKISPMDKNFYEIINGKINEFEKTIIEDEKTIIEDEKTIIEDEKTIIEDEKNNIKTSTLKNKKNKNLNQLNLF